MLDRLVQISQEMLALAGQGEWAQVTDLQQQRQQLIEQTFPLDPQVSDSVNAAAQIQCILDLDRQLTEMARTQQKEIGQALGKLNRGRVATRAYQDTSRR
ncbi:flagellar protein FliT [Sedimenticola thiotaurini]|uniref:Flagellar protein FliT n=1 Tax=Sedimenticola thiotaurini TaxID=1543721 RepID=A0A0F7K034_9GAMM|nr:flagellar protein FliT [Sedimenticola thiotaurini]AKH20268.1 hypothetical protein AAY24_07800 [Sedimenticola thiotaurini]